MIRFEVLKKSDGMTLVEVMITLGVASIMMLGILDLVKLANKSGRNTTINADWSGMIANVRLAFSDDVACQDVLANGGRTYTNNVGFGPTPLGTTPLVFKTSNITLLDAGPLAYSTFSLGGPVGVPNPFPGPAPINGIQVTQASPPSLVTMKDLSAAPGAVANNYSYNLYTLSVNIVGTKKNIADQAGNPNVHSMGGDLLKTNIPIVLKVLTGPVAAVGPLTVAGPPIQPTAVAGCYGQLSPAQACADLGGVYTAPTTPYSDLGNNPCVIRPIQFMGGSSDPLTIADLGPAGESLDMKGERIQLWGMGGPTKGKRAQDDYAIGMNGNSMWFNIGGDGTNFYDNAANVGGVNQFLWYSRTAAGRGGTQSNWFVNATDNSGDNALMALDSGGNLVLNPSNDFDSSRIIFGINATNANAKPGEYISSLRTVTPGNNGWEQGLEFNTQGKFRGFINNGGWHMFGGADDGIVRLVLGGLGAPSFGSPAANSDYVNGTSITSDRRLGNAAFGNISFNVQPQVGPAITGALTLSANADALFTGNVTVGYGLATSATARDLWVSGNTWMQGSATALSKFEVQGSTHLHGDALFGDYPGNNAVGLVNIYSGNMYVHVPMQLDNTMSTGGNVPFGCYTVHSNTCGADFVYSGGITCDNYPSGGSSNQIIESRPSDDRHSWKGFCDSGTNGSPNLSDYTLICCHE